MLKAEWTTGWMSSIRHPRLLTMDTSFPFRKHHAIVQRLTRTQGSLLLQLRTGHIALSDRHG
jgi:hypothetical protein